MKLKKNRGMIILLAVIFAALAHFGYNSFTHNEYVVLGSQKADYPDEWNNIIADSVNATAITINVGGKKYNSTVTDMYMSYNMDLMCSTRDIGSMFECAANVYGNTLKITRGEEIIRIGAGNSVVEGSNGDEPYTVNFVYNEKGGYVSVAALAQLFGYEYKWDYSTNQAFITGDASETKLPSRYNYEEEGRISTVKNQGHFGTCWAFAALTALESSLLPEEVFDFSEDHMTMNNSYNLSQEEGGDYQMAIAYLTAWQGPVFENDDVYGDGVTNETLSAVKHVQEVQIIPAKDYSEIKKMILECGGVQSSIYVANTNSKLIESAYYDKKNNSYCYQGEAVPNHDIVIIGWDDNYSRENFRDEVGGDGAFICRNSWGETFGNNGDFYVSYYDTNIGSNNVVYTKVESADNYDNIYQSDLCGWVGQLGYGSSEAYFSNVYTPENSEELEAVGFYATGSDAAYSVYFCENFESVSSLSRRGDPIVSGSFENPGFYTVNLDKTIHLKKGQKYAIIVKINTPEAERPVAIEFKNDYQTETVDISDGEGYVSLKGIEWESTEQQHGCNVCLKAFTNDVER